VLVRNLAFGWTPVSAEHYRYANEIQIQHPYRLTHPSDERRRAGYAEGICSGPYFDLYLCGKPPEDLDVLVSEGARLVIHEADGSDAPAAGGAYGMAGIEADFGSSGDEGVIAPLRVDAGIGNNERAVLLDCCSAEG
jgi:hypothetical protein